MSTIPFQMKAGWWSFGLMQLLPDEWWRRHQGRIIPATYCLIPYEDLPPIRIQLDNDFRWLRSQPVKKRPLDSYEQPFDKIRAIARQTELTLPDDFSTFMASKELQQRIRSNTACSLFADSVARTNHGFLIPFLSDQQGCVYWHIHLTPGGDYFIAASLDEYGMPNSCGNLYYLFDKEIELEKDDLWFCAPTITEFIYRFWIENEIWYATKYNRSKRPLTPTQQTYFDDFLKVMD